MAMSDEQLKPEEVKAIREIIEKDKRWKWAATTIRNVAAWLAAIITGAVVAWEAFKYVVSNAAKAAGLK